MLALSNYTHFCYLAVMKMMMSNKRKENKNDLITTMAQFLLSAFLLAAAVVVSTAASNNWDFDFDFSGFSNKATLLVTDCSRDVIEQINLVLGGSVTNQCVEIPTTNVNLTHVSCVQDSFMGQAINFTLYKTDDDVATGSTEVQRIEMKVYDKSPEELKAIEGDRYSYAWWFQLDPTLTASDKFFHTFQLKAVGTGVDSHPLVTFTMTRQEGFHLRWRNAAGKVTDSRYPMLTLPDVLGRWIQVRVEAQFYKSYVPQDEQNSGFFSVTLKDENGVQLFPQSQDPTIFYSSMFYDFGTSSSFHWPFIRPKWGMYRNISDLLQDYDVELFQNIQIWKI